MAFEYNKKIVNENKIEDFFSKKNFVGYILPDGSIYECQNHNVSDASFFLRISLFLLDKHYENKQEFLEGKANNVLTLIVQKYLQKASYDEIIALNSFINEYNLSISDLLVQLLGCHLVTRLNKTIVTSLSNHDIFYNYLLHGFTINMVDKIVYDKEKKCFLFQKGMNQNIGLQKEIKEIQEQSYEEERELFYK